MATRALPSELEIQREVEALRDLRRRSITQGALAIDLDLPLNQPPSSVAQSFWPTSTTKPNQDGDSATGSHEGRSLPKRRTSRSDGSHEDNSSTAIDDPSHLFWVPASLHPEIAPAEFRAFLKEHARAPPPSEEPGMSRSSSFSSSSTLSRRKSMLSRQYQPAESDDVEEGAMSLRRNRSHHYANQGPQLTINDLQKLEQLAEEASKTDDPTKFRNIVRRSLSFNLSPSALSHMEEMPDLGDEADIPIIVPPPGQILRRAARTKIRKPSLTGDGGGHRFKPTRRVPAKAATAPPEPRTSSEKSSSDHGESVESVPPERISAILDELAQQRPESYSEETLIIDAYARDEDEESQPQTISPEPATIELPDPIVSALIPPVLPQISLPDVDDGALFEGFETALLSQAQSLQSPEEHRLGLVEPANVPLPISPPRIVDPPVAQAEPASNPFQPLQPPQHPPRSPQVPAPVEAGVQLPVQRKEKDKKSGLFGKWGGDKSSKKAPKITSPSSEKETGFFSSLFSKKKPEVEPIVSAAGREAAKALLGAPTSKLLSPNGTGSQPGMSPNNYSRYPIHVERAIYRLSHIKLANPRRPLYEQVLISNLMFWYLGIINKAQMPAQQPNGQPTANAGVAAGGQSAASVAQPGDNEREQKERAEKERLEREQREREAEAKKKETGKRGPLTKTPVGGSPGGGRRAEMPIKGPQYEMQHRVMEREYVNYAGQGPQGASPGRPNSAPAAVANNNAWGTSNSKIAQPQPQSAIPNHVFQSEPQRKSPPPSSNSTSPAPSGRRSQSPPIANMQRPMSSPRYSPNSSQENLAIPNGRTAGRSLSATAIPSPPMYHVNGRSRKGASALAVLPPGAKRPRSSEGGRTDENAFEEEDVPLAVWQQQRKR